ncbi:MAG: gamma-glutamylcyclotransferase [Alphaproteobacteria bacterium]|nr:gamma-glutamylcyclotransferase [Alphaproteobacteria bacterium]
MSPKTCQPDLHHLTDQYKLTEEELQTTLAAVMASHPALEDLWVFGYGSLMWQPEFSFEERTLATIHGYHRSLCVYSHIWRGTRESPGLVLGLDNGGSCRGIAYRVTAKQAAETVEYLIRREMVTRVYIPRWVTARIGSRIIRAHTYTAAHNHVQYAGKLSDETALHYILQGHGRGGANTDYLSNTVGHLEELGIVDKPLVRLRGLVER